MGEPQRESIKSRRGLREQIITLLRRGDFSSLVELAGRETGVASQLLLFLYDPHDLLQWRAVEGLGHVAGAYPKQVQKLIGRLLWLMNEDSGSFGWGAAAALGEIGRHNLSVVADIIPMFCGFLWEEFSREPMLWGLGRLGEVHPQALEEVAPEVAALLERPDPQIRALAAWSLGKMRYRAAAAQLRDLLTDARPVEFYDLGEFRRATVAQVAGEALAALEAG